MVKYSIDGSKFKVVINCNQDDFNQKHYATNLEWDSVAINEIFDSCLGPNKVSMSTDTVLNGLEMKAMLTFFLGPDKMIVANG